MCFLFLIAKSNFNVGGNSPYDPLLRGVFMMGSGFYDGVGFLWWGRVFMVGSGFYGGVGFLWWGRVFIVGSGFYGGGRVFGQGQGRGLRVGWFNMLCFSMLLSPSYSFCKFTRLCLLHRRFYCHRLFFF